MAHMENVYPRHARGVTLIEALVTVAILAIMLGIAAPALQGFVAGNRLRSTALELRSALQYARAEAIRNNARVTVCKANTTATNCDNAGAWTNGWIVFVDRTPGSAPAVNTGSPADTILRVQPPLPRGIVVQSNGGANYVSFGPDGSARQLNGALLLGTLRVCSTSSQLSDDRRAIDLVIIGSGRIAQETPPNVTENCPAP